MSGQTSLTTDLILRLSGGEQDGELISVNTDKCFLGMAGTSGDGGRPQCAIFRGPKGATLRSFGNDTLVNGESKTVHWLIEGDQIEFPNSMMFEVHQLGYVPAEQEECLNDESDESIEMQTEQETQSTQTCEMNIDAQEKINQLESQITEIKEQNEVVHGRFNELDDRMSQLADQITTLVSIASSGNSLGPNQEESRSTCKTVVDLRIEEAQAAPEASGIESIAPEMPVASDESMKSEWDKIESSNSSETMTEFVETPEAESFVDSYNEEVIEETIETVKDSIETPAETQPETSADSPTETQNESVADLLARMKEEGQWEGVPDEGDDPTPVEPIAEAYSEEPAAAAEGEEADVEDYMSQLLSRMRGGEPAKPVPAEIPTKKEPQPEKKQPEAPTELLKPEEFVPKQKAKKLESLSAMRELANSTARKAVASSEKNVRQETAYVQLAIAVASLIMSGYYLGVESKALLDTGFFVGLFCIGVSSYLGFRFFKNMVLLNDKTKSEDGSQESTEAKAEEVNKKA